MPAVRESSASAPLAGAVFQTLEAALFPVERALLVGGVQELVRPVAEGLAEVVRVDPRNLA